jgi:hypothetical protein
MDAFELVGAGQVAAKNVLKFVFNWDTAAAPKLKAWDDYGMDSHAHRIFAGTTVNGNKPMIGAIGCTVAPAAAWWPAAKVEGAAVDNASLLEGDEGFIELSDGALGWESAESSEFEESSGTGGGTVYANIDFYFPYDLTISDTFTFVLAIEYEYTGDEPQVTAYGNKGTEAVPDWVELTMEEKDVAPSAGVTEIKPCDSGEGGDGTGTYYCTRPLSGQSHPDEIWCRDYPG